MGMKPRVCSICGAKGKENLCNGTGILSGMNLMRACDLHDIDISQAIDKVEDIKDLAVPCPLKDLSDRADTWN